ncbi:enhancer of polycomb-like-domain-containing protein [Radiomyces spectabilis]|uniref:enhancer of polycomb-like-domain-containing protein n=1 Tax=Radiomyces spectabilis TaxID=64574 RepID=UPI00221E8CC8|nr:enhancer of polycomb-like-domain-containing protein [Radiomyces spectabilis]KAI8393952.1 enhancer of polycomb-like-domain-containing protein [Radiomyces spectabilis]
MVSRFRVKKLSPKHPLPVYKESQLPDLSEDANIQRSVPQIETGVEKEEEEEHDLQAAISAAQAAVTTGAKVESYIPTPDASRFIPDDDVHILYKKKFKEPSTLIRFSSTVEDCVGCPYVMDEIDDAFLKTLNKDKSDKLSEDDLEAIMWEFESTTRQHLPHLNLDPTQIPHYAEFRTMLPERLPVLQRHQSILETVFDHWRQRRVKREGRPIIPTLQSEDILKNEIDPYVCFRRRETKPVRKTRRTDQQSLERLRKLRTEMEMARNLLEMVLRREKIRKEGLVLEHTVFDKKCKFREYQRQLGIKEEEDLLPVVKKKRKTPMEGGLSGATIKIPLNKLRRDGFQTQDKSPIQLAIDAELARRKEQDLHFEDITECPYQPFPLSVPDQFFHPLQKGPKQPRFRKRIGRGGRVMLDRANVRLVTGSSADAFESHPYRFDSDASVNEDSEDEIWPVEEMKDSYLRHRVQLLGEVELRNLVTIPFLTPLNMMNWHAASVRASQARSSTPSGIVRAAAPNLSSLPLKRQNSRTKMTPQQAAVAMANGMIAANMAAAVNGSGQNKAAMQMAVAAAQQTNANGSPSANVNATSPFQRHM